MIWTWGGSEIFENSPRGMWNKRWGNATKYHFFPDNILSIVGSKITVLTRVGMAYRSWTVCPNRSTDRARIADNCRIGERTWTGRSAGRFRRTPRTGPYARKTKYIQSTNALVRMRSLNLNLTVFIVRPCF